MPVFWPMYAFIAKDILPLGADPEENITGGQIHEWGPLFDKFKLF
jgi:hypothetical protein